MIQKRLEWTEYWELPRWALLNRTRWAFTILEGMLLNGCGTDLMRRIRSRSESCGGGYWYVYARDARSARREDITPTAALGSGGFRLARGRR